MHRYVALKIVKSAAHYTETAEDEIKLCSRVRDQNMDAAGRACIVELYDHFVHYGPNGKRMRDYVGFSSDLIGY
jgi:serine/threonine-protein kinase SRPK3